MERKIELQQQIEKYFERLYNLVKTISVANQTGNFQSKYTNEFIEFEELLNIDILELLEEMCLLCNQNRNQLWETRIHNFVFDEKDIYIPIELIESEQKIAYFGSNLKIKNLDIFHLEDKDTFKFTNGTDKYSLVSFIDLIELGNHYDAVILDENSLYLEQISSYEDYKGGDHKCDHILTNYKWIQKVRKEDEINRYVDYVNLYRNIKKWYYSIYTGRIFINELNNIIKGKIIESNSFDSYTRDGFISKVYDVYENRISINYLIKKYIEKEVDSDITIRFANLQNRFNGNLSSKSQGYLKISKTNPMRITPIKLSQEELIWLELYLADFRKELYNIMIDNSTSFDDLFYIFFAIKEKYSIELEGLKDFECQTIYDPENSRMYSNLIYKLFETHYRETLDPLDTIRFCSLKATDKFNELFQHLDLLCKKYNKEDSLIGYYIKKYYEDPMVKKYGYRDFK